MILSSQASVLGGCRSAVLSAGLFESKTPTVFLDILGKTAESPSADMVCWAFGPPFRLQLWPSRWQGSSRWEETESDDPK